MKTFRDLKKGDLIYILSEDEPEKIVKTNITSVKKDDDEIKYHLSSGQNLYFFTNDDTLNSSSFWDVELIFADSEAVIEHLQYKIDSYQNIIKELS